MKKILLTMAFVLTALGNAWADGVTVNVSEIPQGSTATLSVSLENSVEYRQLFQFDLELPEGVTVVPNSEGLNKSRFDDNANLSYGAPNEEHVGHRFLCVDASSDNAISGNGGVIMTVQLLATGEIATGLKGTINGIRITKKAGTEEIIFDPVEFTINIGAPLDQRELFEDPADQDPASSGSKFVDVTVHRTIKAGEWSTICLPFDMTEGQVKAAFGNDVEMAEFSNWSYTGTAPDVNSITLEFTPVKTITKHIPYIIKVSNLVESFSVKNIKVAKTSKDKAVYKEFEKDDMISTCYFIGGYQVDVVPEDCIFLSGDKFWRSSGNNVIKAFRAYFSLVDENEDPIVIDESSGARISMSIVEDATKIKDIDSTDDDGRIFNLSGQQVNNPAKKGLYITKGKKVVIK